MTDHGLDQHRYRHLKRIAKKQWLAGKPVKGEHSNQQLWGHVRRMNEDAAHKVALVIATVCAKYAGCVLLFERLRKIKPGKGSTSRRMNRRQANQLRGKINQYAKNKAFAQGVVTVEVNPHRTSQYCSRCGAKGERFSNLGGKRVKAKWGKLFCCPVCHYEANADLNASKNVHHAFYRQWHWQPRKKAPPKAAHLHEDLTVEAMAARAVMSPRTFARRFRATLGASPYHWLLQQRIALAQRLLETTDDPIERIATRCGFSSAATLRLHFRRFLRLSPQSYRTTFHSASA